MAGAVAAAALAAALVVPGSAAAFGPVASFGSAGEGAGQLSAPGAIAVAPDGTFFVADSGNDRVDAFAPSGQFLYAFGKGVRPGGGDVCDPGSGCQRGDGGDAAGALERPQGIAVSASGEVYIAEEGNDRVSVFSASGVFMFAFGYRVDPAGGNVCTAETGCVAGSNHGPPPGPAEEGPVAPAGALGAPTGVAIGAAGRVLVAESENDRISVLDSFGRFLFAFGLEVDSKTFENKCTTDCWNGNPFAGGGISAPGGIATMPDGNLAISDTGNHRIVVYSAEGEFVRAIGLEVDPAGGAVCTTLFQCKAGAIEGAGAVAGPAGLAVSPTGAITVGDAIEDPITKEPGLERVTRFNASGEFVRSFGAGVLDGAAAFQICTALSGCRTGLDSTVPGATPHPFGVVEACGDSTFVAESTSGLSRIERFGEPTTATICALPGELPPPSLVRGSIVPTNFFSLGRLERNRRRGTATLTVSVPVPGRLDLDGRGLMPASRNLGNAATVALPIRLVGKFRRQLLAAGHRRAMALVTFAPDGGNPRTEPRRVTLVKRPQPRRRAVSR